MKLPALIAVVAMLALMSTRLMAADGATAPYNEAVKIVGGKRVVDVAPFPSHMQFAVANFKKPEEFPYQVQVISVETSHGLMDCYGTFWYHPKACSPSTFGKEKRSRTWVVEMNGRWFACGSHSSAKTCVAIIVDGKLRPFPDGEE